MGWRNHPNFSYGNTQNIQNPPRQGRPQGEKGGWEEAVSKLQERSDRTDAAIKNIENQIGQLAKILIERQLGTWPSNTEVNPKEQVNAITTRSGVQLPKIHVKRPGVVKETTKVQETATESNKSKAPNNQEKLEVSAKQRLQEKVMPLPVRPYVPPIPFCQRLRKHKMDKQFEKFLEVFKKLHINIPFANALAQMPSYAKFMKEIPSNKRRLDEHETVMLTKESSAILQNKLPPKLKDPGSFTIPYTIGSLYFEQALCDLGASINLMPYSIFRELGLGEAKPTRMSLQLADRSVKHPRRIVEDILVKVDKFIFPADFVILDMGEDRDVPLILGRPFLATGRALIDVQKGQLMLRLNEEQITFNVFKALKLPSSSDSCFQIDIMDREVEEFFKLEHPADPWEACIMHSQDENSISTTIVCSICRAQNP
ncbi:uncharacterized protein LOC127788099 [Diospyros lotus]|uniref:uncharacterized protein LOC127788099 n=1 Tax=Diospyros lotus TaxID=55363 RepID=UPI0022574BD1|nr:uncharacterized protein LOC127788099 [Diospyros lotus]